MRFNAITLSGNGTSKTIKKLKHIIPANVGIQIMASIWTPGRL